MGMLHSHTSQPKSSLSYPIGHCREQYFPRSGQESSERVEGEVMWSRRNNSSKAWVATGAAWGNILTTNLQKLAVIFVYTLRLNPSVFTYSFDIDMSKRVNPVLCIWHPNAKRQEAARREKCIVFMLAWDINPFGCSIEWGKRTYYSDTGRADIHSCPVGSHRGSRFQTASSFSGKDTAWG